MINNTTLDHYKNIEKIIAKSKSIIEGNVYYKDKQFGVTNLERNEIKIKNLINLSKGKKNICEIGFNAGHSLLLMLDESPSANYTLFDINRHDYTQPCLEYVIKNYPNTTINYIFGDSCMTFSKFASTQNITFDLIHVDGGHSKNVVESDFKNSMLVSDTNTEIIIDDYNQKNIRKVVDLKILQNVVKQSKNILYSYTDYQIVVNKV